MKIECESCRALYNVEERLLEGRKTARFECRKCGASILDAEPENAPGRADSGDPPASPGPASPEPVEAAALPLWGDVGEIDSQATFDSFLASICEPDAGDAPFPPPGPLRERPVRRGFRPASIPRKGAAAAAVSLDAPPEGEVPEAPASPAAAKLAEPARERGVEPPSARPKEPSRPSRAILNYTVSRTVVLDPGRLLGNRCVAFFPEAPEVEPYRVLRTRILQAASEKGGNTVMITSALPLEGKTLTAINLALTFSKTFLETALLVDCDLRQQRIHETLGFESGAGLGDYLTTGCAVSDMIVWPRVEKLTVISGGRTVSESSELLGSPVMKELVEDMKGRYPNRYVFFDVPPVLSGADALAFAPLVDHILFVVRAGATPLPEARRALQMLPREKVIGLVLNRQEER